jgi:hypothetical protein
MRGSVLISLFGMSMAMVGSLVACSGDEDKAAPSAPTGGEGESCTRRADCSSGFKCFEQVCVRSASPGSGGTGGSNEGGGPSTGGTGGATGGTGGKGGSTTGGTGGKGGSATGGSTAAPDLGGLGESCARSADCEEGLGCYNNRCLEEPANEGGGGNVPGPQLGSEGETCVLSSDCDTGLICIPADTGGVGTASVGVCSPADTGIVPTGKSCFAECVEAADCCELPTELHGTLGAKSCTEINQILADAAENCSSPDSITSPLCFARDVYCECADSAWECTAGQCSYEGECVVDGLVDDGCATVSRSGRALTATCDVGGTNQCKLVAGEAFCSSDAECVMQPVTDDLTDTCVANECTCFQGAACLRKCQEDLDCPYGKRCDTGPNVCVPEDTCVSDVTCQEQLGDYRATCMDGACTVPCELDIDCNPDGLTGENLSMVCDEGSCKPIGCTDHRECQNQADLDLMVANPRKMFCQTVATGMAGVVGSSAITD